MSAWTYRIQGCGAIKLRLKAGSALIVIPTAPSGAIVLEPIKARPQKRRANEAWVGKKKRKKDALPCLNFLTKKAPYKRTWLNCHRPEVELFNRHILPSIRA